MQALGAQRTAHRYEVIVVHSGEDDTLAVAQAALPGVRVRQLPERALAATARNAGVAIARGAILAFVDSDVYVDEAWLDAVVSAAATGADLICGSIANANPENAVSRAEQIVMFSEFFPETPERPMWFALSGNTVMRRDVYDRCGPFVEVRAAEDLIFSRRLRMAGARILFYPRMRVFHDNRKTVRPYLRNQVVLGKYTAMARRIVPFEDTSSYWLFVLAVPISPLAKLGKIGWRLYRWMPRQLLALLRELPLVLLGVLAYGVGQAIGAAAALRGRSNPFEAITTRDAPAMRA
jgi:GT2 family glycosyltransferase